MFLYVTSPWDIPVATRSNFPGLVSAKKHRVIQRSNCRQFRRWSIATQNSSSSCKPQVLLDETVISWLSAKFDCAFVGEALCWIKITAIAINNSDCISIHKGIVNNTAVFGTHPLYFLFSFQAGNWVVRPSSENADETMHDCRTNEASVALRFSSVSKTAKSQEVAKVPKTQ